MTQAQNVAIESSQINSSGVLQPAGGGTGVTTSTGTGSVVLNTSPTLVTPNLGTPSTLVGTNITGTAANFSIGGNAATASAASGTTFFATNASGEADIGVLGAGQNAAYLYNNAYGWGLYSSSGGSLIFYSRSDTSTRLSGTPINFYTNPGQVGTFDTNGNFLVGYTSQGGSAVKIAADTIGIGNVGTSSTTSRLKFAPSTAGTNVHNIYNSSGSLIFAQGDSATQSGNTTIMTLSASGNLNITGTYTGSGAGLTGTASSLTVGSANGLGSEAFYDTVSSPRTYTLQSNGGGTGFYMVPTASYGATFGGTITTASPTYVTSLSSATSGVINVPGISAPNSGVNYIVGYHQTSVLSGYGYQQHTVFGQYRPANAAWGSTFIGVGGNDAYPTVIYTFDYQGNFSAQGAVYGAAKYFKIPHPLPALSNTHNLVHVSVEAPQADLIYRGTTTLVNGTATIDIDQAANMTDGTFVLLCKNVQCFTTNESDWDAVKGSIKDNQLTISCQNPSSTATISWMVIGQRQDTTYLSQKDIVDSNGNLIVEPLDTTPEEIPPISSMNQSS